jgi:hypothetical protein
VFARARVFPSFDFEFWFDAYQRIGKTVLFGSGQSTDTDTSRLILAIVWFLFGCRSVDWELNQSTGQWQFRFFELKTSRLDWLQVDWSEAFSNVGLLEFLVDF